MISDAEIAAMIHARLERVRAGGTICPSEVARALADDWRPLMGDVRRVAAGMGSVKVTQKGVVVDPLAAKGPIRLGRC